MLQLTVPKIPCQRLLTRQQVLVGYAMIKKSEPESLAEQSIAATNSSQNILSLTLDSRSARPSNLSAGLGLHSASTTNLSAVLNLHSTSCFKSNQSFVGKYVSNFQLVVAKFRWAIHQGIQAKLRWTIQAKLRQNKVTQATIRSDSSLSWLIRWLLRERHCVLRDHNQLQQFYATNFAGVGWLLILFQRPQILCCRQLWTELLLWHISWICTLNPSPSWLLFASKYSFTSAKNG